MNTQNVTYNHLTSNTLSFLSVVIILIVTLFPFIKKISTATSVGCI